MIINISMCRVVLPSTDSPVSAMRLSKEIITGATKDLARGAVHAQFADLLVALKKQNERNEQQRNTMAVNFK